MALDRPSYPLAPAARLIADVALTLALTCALAVGLTGCGRNGALELPPSAAAAPTVAPASAVGITAPTAAAGTPQDIRLKTGFDAYGNPVAAPGQKRPFILDPILQ